MRTINIVEVLSTDTDIKTGDILVAETKDSYLIGPIVKNNFCRSCFRKRINSSSFFEVSGYKRFKNSRLIQKFIKTIAMSKIKVGMMEIMKSNNKEIFFHPIIKVPGCKCSGQ